MLPLLGVNLLLLTKVVRGLVGVQFVNYKVSGRRNKLPTTGNLQTRIKLVVSVSLM